MKKFGWLLGSVFFLIVGCGTKQDPMDGKPNEVKDGRLPVQKVQLPAPIESDAVRILSADKFTFREGEEGRLALSASVLEKDYGSIIEISNIAEFPGAFFDTGKNEFVWTPVKGFIYGGAQSGDSLSKDMTLKVRAFGKHNSNGDAIIFTREKSIDITVVRERSIPKMSVTGIKDSSGNQIIFVEDQTYRFEVKVIDEDSGNKPEMRPRLEILSLENADVNLAPLVKIESVEFDYKRRESKFTLVMRTGNSNLTRTWSGASFGLRALSRFNVSTPMISVESKIVASFGSLDTTWKNQMTLYKGSKITVPFMIWEGTGRANIKVEVINKPQGADVECENGYLPYPAIKPCKLVWDITNHPEGYGQIDLKVTAYSLEYEPINHVVEEMTLDFVVRLPTLPNNPNQPADPEER